eukprot:7921018-Ditylum_brightwellii.AAC.1
MKELQRQLENEVQLDTEQCKDREKSEQQDLSQQQQLDRIRNHGNFFVADKDDNGDPENTHASAMLIENLHEANGEDTSTKAQYTDFISSKVNNYMTPLDSFQHNRTDVSPGPLKMSREVDSASSYEVFHADLMKQVDKEHCDMSLSKEMIIEQWQRIQNMANQFVVEEKKDRRSQLFMHDLHSTRSSNGEEMRCKTNDDERQKMI